MKKNDFIIIGIVLLCSFLFYIGYHLYVGDGEEVVVLVDGEEYGTYYLGEDQVVSIHGDGGTNVLEIKDGEASMVEADCPDGLCMHQASISNNRESIICLPNKVVVEVRSSEESEYDVIAQ